MTQASATVLQRLRSADLRPTIARISILQVIDAQAPGRLCVEDVFRQLLRRGLKVSNGTVYRVTNELEAAGLLVREWSRSRKAYYRSRLLRHSARTLRLVCGASGRSLELEDDELLERLLAAAGRHGMEFEGLELTVHLGAPPAKAHANRSLPARHDTWPRGARAASRGGSASLA